MIKITLLIFAVLAVLILAAVCIGMLLPQSHVVARSMHVNQRPEVVYTAISNLKNAPAWRKDIEAVDEVKGDSGETLYREKSKHGVLSYRIARNDVPTKFVTTIAERDAPFSGSWIFDLAEENGGTRITITERGEVYSPVFRFVARFIFGYHKTMEIYLADLAAHFSQVGLVQDGVPGDM